MNLYQEQERLCRQLGDLDGLANSLANQAELFGLDLWPDRGCVAAPGGSHGAGHKMVFGTLVEKIIPLQERLKNAAQAT